MSGLTQSPGVTITASTFYGTIYWDASTYQKPGCSVLLGQKCGYALIDGVYYGVFQNTEIFGWAGLYNLKTGYGPDLSGKVGHAVTFYY